MRQTHLCAEKEEQHEQAQDEGPRDGCIVSGHGLEEHLEVAMHAFQFDGKVGVSCGVAMSALSSAGGQTPSCGTGLPMN